MEPFRHEHTSLMIFTYDSLNWSTLFNIIFHKTVFTPKLTFIFLMLPTTLTWSEPSENHPASWHTRHGARRPWQLVFRRSAVMSRSSIVAILILTRHRPSRNSNDEAGKVSPVNRRLQLNCKKLRFSTFCKRKP
jgi:hypothetical protein